ncbi:MAG: hypothetical protein WDW38_001650 [Sanguina aurantia]
MLLPSLCSRQGGGCQGGESAEKGPVTGQGAGGGGVEQQAKAQQMEARLGLADGVLVQKPMSWRERARVQHRGFILLQNRAGKTRLSKYYVPIDDSEKRKLEYEVHRLVVNRDPKHTNFVEFKTHKVVYQRYAGLFFSMCIDTIDNELMSLEAIHLFVEILDHYFSNVCELDLVFNFHKVYLILDEFICGGEIQESAKKVILERLAELDKIDT